MERGLRLVHFSIKGGLPEKPDIEKVLLDVNGIEDVDFISEDSMLYISFDSELISIDNILEIFQKNNVNIK